MKYTRKLNTIKQTQRKALKVVEWLPLFGVKLVTYEYTQKNKKLYIHLEILKES